MLDHNLAVRATGPALRRNMTAATRGRLRLVPALRGRIPNRSAWNVLRLGQNRPPAADVRRARSNPAHSTRKSQKTITRTNSTKPTFRDYQAGPPTSGPAFLLHSD